MPRVIVFDVNETLLDLRALDPLFERVFGDASVRREWFTQMLMNAMMTTLTERYTDFGTIGGAALQVTAARRGVDLPEDVPTELAHTMRRLPPHADVEDNLQRLRDAGFRLAALTNSAKDAADAQLDHAGLYGYFEQVLSVDAAGRFKPAPEPYQMAVRTLGIAARDMRLVAAHDWDVTGALRAGSAAAYVARPGMTFSPLADRPDIYEDDLHAVTDRILAIDSPA